MSRDEFDLLKSAPPLEPSLRVAERARRRALAQLAENRPASPLAAEREPMRVVPRFEGLAHAVVVAMYAIYVAEHVARLLL